MAHAIYQAWTIAYFFSVLIYVNAKHMFCAFVCFLILKSLFVWSVRLWFWVEFECVHATRNAQRHRYSINISHHSICLVLWARIFAVTHTHTHTALFSYSQKKNYLWFLDGVVVVAAVVMLSNCLVARAYNEKCTCVSEAATEREARISVTEIVDYLMCM